MTGNHDRVEGCWYSEEIYTNFVFAIFKPKFKITALQQAHAYLKLSNGPVLHYAV
jgi:hypothetical protein